MKNLFLSLFLFCIFIHHTNFAQKNTLTLKEFYDQIMAYHPLVKQASTLPDFAKQELRMARGGFDPKLAASYSRKDFDKKTYYDHLEGKLKAPTWIGNVFVGAERNRGDLLNPESTTDRNGLATMGIDVPLGKDFWIDQRRATLKQAKIFQNIALADKIKIINKILLTAAKDYWEWYFAERELFYLIKGLELAEDRFKAVKLRVTLGELAAIDSVQAKIIYQERKIQLNQANLEVKNSRLTVMNYIWGDNDLPLVLSDDVNPENPNWESNPTNEIETLVAFAKENHPEILKIKGKVNQLEVERQLGQNSLLPVANFQYALLQNMQPATESTRLNFEKNFKLGLDFEFPLFLRKERGKLGQTKIKKFQNELDLRQTQRDIETEIRKSYNELLNLRLQIAEQTSMVQNYQILRDGEYRRFLNGESSLFLINTQETKLIESQIKLESQKMKFEKARAMLLWAIGKAMWE
ncbi:MAG: TolC family protein [Bacteroidetes bacterium]|nr:MAG: TolC family protein [Bacteroidota bacterium]TAG88252.1 MAG: TolC family protein [Bacteroidota bacterium]